MTCGDYNPGGPRTGSWRATLIWAAKPFPCGPLYSTSLYGSPRMKKSWPQESGFAGGQRARGQVRGRIVSVRFDLHGTHYGEGKGLKLFVDGKLAKRSPTMAKLTVQL